MDFFAFNAEGAAPKAPRSPRGKVRLIISFLPAAASPGPEEGDLSRMGSGRVNLRGLRASTSRPRVGRALASVPNQPCSRAPYWPLQQFRVPCAGRAFPLTPLATVSYAFRTHANLTSAGAVAFGSDAFPLLARDGTRRGKNHRGSRHQQAGSRSCAQHGIRFVLANALYLEGDPWRYDEERGRVSSGASRVRSSARAWKPILVHRRWTSRGGSASLEWAGTRARMNL